MLPEIMGLAPLEPHSYSETSSNLPGSCTDHIERIFHLMAKFTAFPYQKVLQPKKSKVSSKQNKIWELFSQGSFCVISRCKVKKGKVASWLEEHQGT